MTHPKILSLPSHKFPLTLLGDEAGGFRFWSRRFESGGEPVVLVIDPLGFHQTLILERRARAGTLQEEPADSVRTFDIPGGIDPKELTTRFSGPEFNWLRLAYASVSTDPHILRTLFQLSRDNQADRLAFEVLWNNPATPEDIRLANCCLPGTRFVNKIGFQNGRAREFIRRNSYAPTTQYPVVLKAPKHLLAEVAREDIGAMLDIYHRRSKRLKAEDGEGIDGMVWGMNYGHGRDLSGRKIHASSQHIHFQYFGTPPELMTDGDRAALFCSQWAIDHPACPDFFEVYLDLLRNSPSVVGEPSRVSLVVWEDESVILAVPPAQRAYYDLQIICKDPDAGNITETTRPVRLSLREAWYKAFQVYSRKNIQMFSALELSRRFWDSRRGQRLMYTVVPKPLGYPMGYLEYQNVWVSSNLPESFAAEARSLCER